MPGIVSVEAIAVMSDIPNGRYESECPGFRRVSEGLLKYRDSRVSLIIEHSVPMMKSVSRLRNFHFYVKATRATCFGWKCRELYQVTHSYTVHGVGGIICYSVTSAGNELSLLLQVSWPRISQLLQREFLHVEVTDGREGHICKTRNFFGNIRLKFMSNISLFWAGIALSL
jgi:hypothetical protein